VSFAQDEPVTFRMVRRGGIDPEHVEVQRRQDVGTRQVAARMPETGCVRHAQAGAPDSSRADGDLGR
jgi:hypothetical protein